MLALFLLTLTMAPVFTAFECGVVNKDPSGSARVVGGRPVTFFKYPWYASIHQPFLMNNQVCGGALIAPQYVMTAANCFENRDSGKPRENSYRVTLGMFNQCKDTPSIAITYKISKIYVHPKFFPADEFSNLWFYDIALVKLKGASGMMPVCLPPKGAPIMHVNNATVLGFGRLDENDYEEQPCELNEATVEIYTNQECRNQSSIPKNYSNQMVETQNSFCAGKMEGGTGTCMEDVGTSVLIKKSNRYFSMGVSSFGYGCADEGFPDVYTNVASFIDWINDTMQGELKMYRPKKKQKDPFLKRLVHFVTG